MKHFSLLLALVSALAPATSHALVRELALCTTSDGRFTVSVQGNQGIGRVREEKVSAHLSDASGRLVAVFPEVELYKGPRSISFGRPHYLDIPTQGGKFLLEGPSTNFRHYSLHVEAPTGELNDDNLHCTVFEGRILGGIVFPRALPKG